MVPGEVVIVALTENLRNEHAAGLAAAVDAVHQVPRRGPIVTVPVHVDERSEPAPAVASHRDRRGVTDRNGAQLRDRHGKPGRFPRVDLDERAHRAVVAPFAVGMRIDGLGPRHVREVSAVKIQDVRPQERLIAEPGLPLLGNVLRDPPDVARQVARVEREHLVRRALAVDEHDMVRRGPEGVERERELLEGHAGRRNLGEPDLYSRYRAVFGGEFDEVSHQPIHHRAVLVGDRAGLGILAVVVPAVAEKAERVDGFLREQSCAAQQGDGDCEGVSASASMSHGSDLL